MALRKIVTVEDPILHKRCRRVETVDDKIKAILQDMAETLHNTPNGGGLAACQVGILKRLVVIDLGEGLVQLVNPEIIRAEGARVVTEGCLSIPNVWGTVERPEKVTVRALDENEKEVVLEAGGDMAKCLCHEIDHLDGIVFTDKMIERVALG